LEDDWGTQGNNFVKQLDEEAVGDSQNAETWLPSSIDIRST